MAAVRIFFSSSALAAMVAGLTIGKKGYEDTGEIMKHIQKIRYFQIY